MNDYLIDDLLEICIECIEEGKQKKALELIEAFWVSEQDDYCSEKLYYVYLLYAEIIMGEYPDDYEKALSALDSAHMYIENSDSFNYSDKVCLLVDYSKYFLDRMDYESAEAYVVEAVSVCLKKNIVEQKDIAIHNFLLFIFASCLPKLPDEKIREYALIVQAIFMDNEKNLSKIDSTMILLDMADFSFMAGNTGMGEKYLETAISVEEPENPAFSLCYIYITDRRNKIYKWVSSTYLKSMVIGFAHNMVEKLDEYLPYDDKGIFSVSKQISSVLRLYLTYVNMGVISYDSNEYIEMITNLKNIYTFLVKNRRKGCHEKNHWISLEEITKKLNEGEYFIDYTQFPAVVRDYGEQMYGDLAFSIMSAKKTKTGIEIIRHSAPSLIIERWINVLLEGVTRTSKTDEMTLFFSNLLNNDGQLSKSMYGLFIADALRGSFGIKKLIVSPDVEMMFTPFALFMDADDKFLIDNYEIVYIDSLRDYQGEIDYKSINYNSAMVIGDARFSVKVPTYNTDMKLLQPLPLSKIEASIVSEILGVNPLTKTAAIKDLLRKPDVEILHLATHGSIDQIDEECESNSDVSAMQRCKLYLAGANDFLMTSVESKEFENGIITGEELMSYDLSSIKMAVLSVCFSGKGIIDYSQGALGFRTAFLSHGVRVVVTSLWEVGDFASAVFMKHFYEGIKMMTASSVLRECQLYLRKVTIKELREAGWFDAGVIKKIGLVAEEMKRISLFPDDYCIFEKPKYWAGFIVIEQ